MNSSYAIEPSGLEFVEILVEQSFVALSQPEGFVAQLLLRVRVYQSIAVVQDHQVVLWSNDQMSRLAFKAMEECF